MSPRATHHHTLAVALALVTVCVGDAALSASQPHCATVDTTTIRQVRANVQPSYFFKAVPGTDLVALATRRGNVLLDLSAAVATAVRIPGTYDPIPSFPDGRMVSVSDGKLRFYSLAGLLRDGLAARPFFVSDRVLMTGVYQSVARLTPPGPQATYRVSIVSNQDGWLRYQDLTVRFDGDEPVGAIETDLPQRLCANLRREELSLPMLSKNGRELALLVGRSTKVYRIEGQHCEQVLDLGIATGKLDFSFDGRQLLFHIGVNERASTSDGGSPWQSAGLRPWHYDRDARPGTNPFRFIGLHAAGNAYYPVFDNNGNVIYLHAEPRGDAVDFSFVYASRPVSTTVRPSGSARAAAALGRLWVSECTADHEQARIFPLQAVPEHLDPVACRRLVDRFGSQPSAITSAGAIPPPGNPAALSRRALRAACP